MPHGSFPDRADRARINTVDSDRSRRALGARLCVDPLRQDRQEFLRSDLRRGGAEGLRSHPAVRDAGAVALVAVGQKHADPEPFLSPRASPLASALGPASATSRAAANSQKARDAGFWVTDKTDRTTRHKERDRGDAWEQVQCLQDVWRLEHNPVGRRGVTFEFWHSPLLGSGADRLGKTTYSITAYISKTSRPPATGI